MPDADAKPPIEERQAWVAQVQKDLRGDDLDMPLNDMVKAYRSTVKERDELKSAPKGIVVPDEKATPEQKLAFKKALGIPDSPDGYNLEIPEAVKDLIRPEEIKDFKLVAHELDLTPKQVKRLNEWEMVRAQSARKAFVDSVNEQGKKTRDKLIEKYGAKVDEKIAGALKVIEQFGSKEVAEKLKEPIGNNFELIDTLINISTLFVERGMLPTGTGSNAAGGIDLKQIYPTSAAQMGLK